MVEKKYHHQDTDTLYAKRKEDEKNWEEFGTQAQEVYKDFWRYNDGQSGEKAKSTQDAGRACVRCGGQLMVFEEGENGNILLECRSCQYKQWNADIMPYSKEELKEMDKFAKEAGAEKAQDIPDMLYRTIPDDLVREYMEMRARQRGN